jgi:hypothetical protein
MIMGNVGQRARRALALSAATAAVLACAAPSAHADNRLLDEDSVKIESQGFDFGDGSFVLGELTNSGRVEWLVDDNDVTPVLTGELHLNDVEDECARMRIDYYTSATVFLTTRYGGTVCADDDGHHSWNVDHLSPHTDYKIGRVKVSLQHELSNGSWASVGSAWSTLSTYTDDNVMIFSYAGLGTKGFDFGDDDWDPFYPHPMGGGEVEWGFSEGRITPHLTGTLHLNNVAGACARMRIDYYADDGADSDILSDFLTTVYGGVVCAEDNSHYRWSVDRKDYTGDDIRHVKVSIESLQDDGSWENAGSEYSYFGT